MCVSREDIRDKMQYAEVAVDTKTSLDRQTFTYSIPPQLLPDVKLGILVLVPFHGRKLQGVILSFKHLSTGTFKHKLKSIIKIIDPNPVLDSTRLTLAKWMSQYYLTPIGEVIFSMIPPTAMRQIINIDYQNISKLGEYQASHKNAIAFLCDKKKPINIYTLYNRIDERWKTYLKLIEKAIVKNKSSLILFPNINQAKEFQSLLQSSRLSSNNINGNQEIKSVLYHSQMTKTQRYLVWNDIRNNKYQVVVGTRPTIFAPTNNLGLIIIDQPDNFGYKEDQLTRYHSVTVAKYLNNLFESNLVLGSLVPNVEAYYYEQTGRYQKLQSKPTKSVIQINKRIIDLTSQKNKIVSWELEQSIKNTLNVGGKVLLFSQRKGEGSSFICQDCGNVFKCDKCGLPFTQVTNHQSQITNLSCNRCGINLPTPKSCIKCRGVRLKSLGLGVDKILKEVVRLFPNVKSITIDVDSDNINNKIEKNQIIISTIKITDFPNLNFDLVAIINLDNLLNLPDYKSGENVYLLICNLLYLCKKDFIFQTFNPENILWNFISKSCPNFFLQNELLARKDNNFPPYSQLVKLTYQNQENNKCVNESENLKSKILNHKLIFLGPSPSFFAKMRDKYQFQIIVFIKNKSDKERLTKVISTLPKGWKIDVDPISLI